MWLRAYLCSLRVPQHEDKGDEATDIPPLDVAVEKDARQLAQEECVARAEALTKSSRELADIWGTARRQQLERLRAINAALPREFQIPEL